MYIKVRGKDKYLDRAADSKGNTWTSCLLLLRDVAAAERFFCKTLKTLHTCFPRVITVDKNAAYPKAFDELKAKKELHENVELRQKKYLNNIIEQDHRSVKQLVKPGMGFGSFNTAQRTIRGMKL